jgi:hypothetical protein
LTDRDPDRSARGLSQTLRDPSVHRSRSTDRPIAIRTQALEIPRQAIRIASNTDRDPNNSEPDLCRDRSRSLPGQIAIYAGQFPFTANGRARALGDTRGLVKILADRKTDRILGMHVIGPMASELISEGVVAMEFGAASEDLARICHAHPSLSEVTKEAAGMILADDNFASITAAVREGRTVYNNIEKAILFMLPTNVAQALVIMSSILVGFIAPITARQILWVNMVTSVALGLVISFEPHEWDVMRRPPRAVDSPIVDGFGAWRISFVGVALLALTLWAFFWMQSQNASGDLARTVAVNALVIGQVFYLLNSRFKFDSSLSLKAHLGNPYLPVGIGVVLILQLLYTYAPPFQALFETEAVPARIWPWLFLGGFVFFLVVEAEKVVIRSSASLPAE